MQVSFNKRTILPSVYKNEKGSYFSTTIFSPVKYQLQFGEGLMPVDQMKAVMEKCAEEATEVEIEFTESSGKFGPQIQIFSIKPIQKPMPTAIKTA